MENDVKGNQISQRNRSRASYNISRDMSKRSLSWISCVCVCLAVTLSKPDATHSFVIHKIPFRFHSNGETYHRVFMLNHFFPSHLSTATKKCVRGKDISEKCSPKINCIRIFFPHRNSLNSLMSAAFSGRNQASNARGAGLIWMFCAFGLLLA